MGMIWISMDSSVGVQVSVILKYLFATKLQFFSFSWRELRFKTLNKPAKNQNPISGYE